jgi:hypothetical protein
LNNTEEDRSIQPIGQKTPEINVTNASTSDVSLAEEFLPATTPVYIQSEADLRPKESQIGTTGFMKSEPISVAYCPLNPEPDTTVADKIFDSKEA